MNHDRRDIAGLLGPHFPIMAANATSNDWHGFLDNITGLSTPLDEANATAFDRWRQALAVQGYPVWTGSAEKTAAVKARAEQLVQAEAKRLAKQPELLAKLNKEAPLVTAAELLKQAKKSNG